MDKYNMEMETDINSIPGKVINQVKPNSTVLEFGPASGRMTRYMKEKLGCKVYIVEIEEEAYNRAIQYAEDGICGNIEDYEWEDKFKDIKFDYIIFADVLEHLQLPHEAIKRTDTLLKDEGRLIVSIPNIGHGDILLKLYFNRFEYTNIGLLDDTHVHFWGYHNVEDYFRKYGFSIQIEDATYMAPFFTEQRIEKEKISFELRNLIYRREMSNVYEFFLVLRKSSYFYQENLKKETLIKYYMNDDLCTTVFFDCGEGYKQENSVALYPTKICESNCMEYYVENVPENCHSIRFDPTENIGVIVSDFKVVTNNGRYKGNALNGVEIQDQLLFSHYDPQIEVNLEPGCKWIKIELAMYKYTNAKVYEIIQGLKDINKFKQEVERLKQEVKDFEVAKVGLEEENVKISNAAQEYLRENEELNKIIESIENDRLELYKKLENCMQEKNELSNRIISELDKIVYIQQKNQELVEEKISLQQELLNTKNNFEQQEADVIARLQSETQQKEALFNELNECKKVMGDLHYQLNQINYAYNVVIDSQCWKITKPIRVMLEIIKATKIGKLSHKTLFYIKHFGVKKTIYKILDYVRHNQGVVSSNILSEHINEEVGSFKKLINIFKHQIEGQGNKIYLENVLESYDKIKKNNVAAGKTVLLVSHELALTGAPIALYYFAKSLKASGHYPVIMCRTDGRLTEDITSDGIPVIIYGETYTDNLIEKMSSLFDIVVANTIVSYPVVNMLSDKNVSVIWWIHEAIVSYSEEILAQMMQTVSTNVQVYCVGAYAKKVLLNYRNLYSTKNLLYYVPETSTHEGEKFKIDNPDNKMIFAIIGMQEIRKGQDVLVEAIERLQDEVREKALFVFIGRPCNPYIGEKIQGICKKYPSNTRYIEELTQQQIHQFYEQMDCFVCASKDDPMPIVVTEAMMHSKVIICSENTGSAELLNSMNSGLVYYNDDYVELSEKIGYVIENMDNLDEIRKNARATYDKYFSKVVFDENVKNIISAYDVKLPEICIPLESSGKFFMKDLITRFKEQYMCENDIVMGEEILEEYDKNTRGRKILLVSHELSLTGAPIAVHYLAKVLKENGDCPIILSPYDGKMREEIYQDDIPVIVYGGIYATDFLAQHAEYFDLIVLNTVVPFISVIQLKESLVPIMWWIHDSNASYDIGGFKSCLPSELPKNLSIYCAGDYAKSALIKNYPDYKADTFLYFVPDLKEKLMSAPTVDIGNSTDKFTFTIIGMQDERKGQDIYVDAIELLEKEMIENCNFVFIGKKMSPRVWDKIQALLEKYPENTKYIEEVSRDEMVSVYDKSDCVVCASKDDPMPIFVTEAMLMSKLVICSEYTGSAALINEMNSGFVYEKNDPKLLAEKMEYVYKNSLALDDIRENGRKTYEKYFSHKAFKQNVEDIVSSLYVNKEDYFDGIVSVVIPTYNAGESFRELISLLKHQEKIRKMEITIVDSGSKDNTVEICKSEKVNLIQITHEQFSHSFARNLGADNSKGDIIIFMTQDAMPTSTLWASNLIKPIINEGIAAVSCSEICNDNIELYYKVSSYMHSKYIGVDKGDVICSLKDFKSYDELRRNASLNDVTCVVNHKVFNAFRYRFDYAEDLDLGIRLIKSGYNLKLMSSERVIHGHNRNAGYYVKRALVEDRVLSAMMNNKQESRNDNIISKRIIIGYKGINTIINNMREDVQDKIAVNVFFDKLNNQFDSILEQDILNMVVNQIIYDDAILDETVNKLHEYCNDQTGNEINDIIYMCHYYATVTLKQYLELQCYELELEDLESIYDAIYKQMAVFIGIDLARLEQNSQLKEYVDTLTAGV